MRILNINHDLIMIFEEILKMAAKYLVIPKSHQNCLQIAFTPPKTPYDIWHATTCCYNIVRINPRSDKDIITRSGHLGQGIGSDRMRVPT